MKTKTLKTKKQKEQRKKAIAARNQSIAFLYSIGIANKATLNRKPLLNKAPA